MAKVSDEVLDFSNMSDEEKNNFAIECVNKICNVNETSSVCDWSTGGETLYIARFLGLLLTDLLTILIKQRSLKN